MPAGPPKGFSLTEAGQLLRDYEIKLREACRLEYIADRPTVADETAARSMVRASRLALLEEFRRLQVENEKLTKRRDELVVINQRLNSENRMLADVALAERDRVNERIARNA